MFKKFYVLHAGMVDDTLGRLQSHPDIPQHFAPIKDECIEIMNAPTIREYVHQCWKDVVSTVLSCRSTVATALTLRAERQCDFVRPHARQDQVLMDSRVAASSMVCRGVCKDKPRTTSDDEDDNISLHSAEES
eukprot:Blabericola_migrator_1__11543@NODE_68_length_15625_cov_137_110426_g61_i0_p9_GENE_NODE_68_length_15625_cov_137_110426_g61_i0NODE_68_length_15625_cov_137_110426_g61_i0_p9_ORF_typecomplete_len133_score13_78_NODE_68_length_15625_cov_137_110426_g61_i059976395